MGWDWVGERVAWTPNAFGPEFPAELEHVMSLKIHMLNWEFDSDSFAAGPGAGDPIVLPDEPRECKRNTGGYPNSCRTPSYSKEAMETQTSRFSHAPVTKYQRCADCARSTRKLSYTYEA